MPDLIPTESTEALVTSKNVFPVGKELVILAVMLGLLFGVAAVPQYFARLSTPPPEENVAAVMPEPVVEEEAPAPEYIDTFSSLSLAADAAYVYDVQNNVVLYEASATKMLPLASVTKLMTALLAQEILDPNELITISDSAVRTEGDSGLREGEQFTVQDLSDLMLITSSNDGAEALAEAAGNRLQAGGSSALFVEAMNLRALDLGMRETIFHNPSGLDRSTTQSGAEGSAADVAKLLSYIITNHPEILESTREPERSIYNRIGGYHRAINTNYTTSDITGLLGSKTGYTDLAGGNLAVSYDPGLARPITVVVLSSSRSQRFSDVIQLIDATNNFLESAPSTN